jgi:tetratricopeptide (TPR) repeat protein
MRCFCFDKRLGKRGRKSSEGFESSTDAEAKKQRPDKTSEKPSSSQNDRVLYNIPHFADHAYYPRGNSRSQACCRFQTALTRSSDKALDRVYDGLKSPHKTFGIHGLGGVGKTQLALSYVSRYGYRYHQVIWIFADSETKLFLAFAELASRLNLAPTSKPSTAECVQLVRDWFSSNTEYLLVYDNADDLNVIRGFLPSPGGSLLITSRTPNFVKEGVVADGLELPSLRNSDGAKYLLRNLESSTHDRLIEDPESDVDMDHEEEAGSDFRPMVKSKYSADNPENMSHVASCIRAEGSLADFLEEFQRHRDALDIDFSPEGASYDYQGSYKDCWEFSFSKLENSSAERLLGLLSFFDPDSIPDRLLRDYAKSDLNEIAPLESNPAYRNAFTALQNHALATRDDHHNTLSVHRLVRNAIARRLQSSPGKIQRSFEDAVKCLSRVFPRQKQGHSMEADHGQCRIYAPQLLAVQDSYKYLRNVRTSEVEPNGNALFAELLCHCGWYLYETAQSGVALDVLETAKGIADDKARGVEPRLKGLIYSNIGVVLSALNRAEEGLNMSKEALDIRLDHLPPNDPQIGESSNNCAGCYHDLGQLVEAQRLYQHSVNLQEESPVRNENLLESAYSNLGRNLMALGRLHEADTALEKARSFHTNCTSGLFFISMTIFLIGNLRMCQERWEDAEAEHQTALKMRLTFMGPMNRLTGVSYHQVARLLHRRGIDHGQNPPGAIEMLRKALKSFKADPAEPGLAPRTKLLLSSVLARVAERTANYELAAESKMLKDEAAHALHSEPTLRHLPYGTDTEQAMLVQYEYR